MNRVASSLALIIVGCAVVYALPTISSGSSPDSMFDSIIPEDSRDSPEIEFPVGNEGNRVIAAANQLNKKAKKLHKKAKKLIQSAFKTKLGAVVSGRTGQAPTEESRTVNAMQWSPHFRCFMPGFFKATCEPQVKRMLPIFVKEHKLDFINLGMFQIEDTAPYFQTELKEFKHVTYKCGMDTITFAFNSDIWEPMAPWSPLPEKEWPEAELEKVLKPAANNINNVACSNINVQKDKSEVVDRVYAVMGFTRKTGSESSWKDRVIVVGGHMPHPQGGTSGNPDAATADIPTVLNNHIGEKIKYIKTQPGWGNAHIVVIADFNVDFPDKRNTAFDSSVGINKAFEQMSTLTWTKFVSNMLGMIRAPAETDAKVGDEKVMDQNEPATVAYALKQPNGGWVAQPVLENSKMFESLGMLKHKATERFGTCCASKPAVSELALGPTFYEVIFPYAFDRILTSGMGLETVMPLRTHLASLEASKAAELQEALLQGDFHMPIVAKISYKPMNH